MKKGIALFIVIATFLVLNIFVIILLASTSGYYRLPRYQYDSARAAYFAEAGIQAGLHRIRNDQCEDIDPYTITFVQNGESHSVSFDIEPNNNNATDYTIDSTNTTSSASLRIRATVTSPNSPQITSYIVEAQ